MSSMRRGSIPVLLLAGAFCAAGPAHANLKISSDPSSNVNCEKHVCTATSPSAVLNVKRLARMLAADNVRLVPGKTARNIIFSSALSWTSASTLVLDAYESILINSTISLAGPGALSIKTNDGGGRGDLRFGRKGQVTFLSTANALKINGQIYTLVNGVASLATAANSKPGHRYALANNYDASVDGVYPHSPVRKFWGTFEGLGNTISNLAIDDQTANATVGLFGIVGFGTVRDLVLHSASIKAGKGARAGLLIGQNGGTVVNSFGSGSLSAGDGAVAGGLVGYNLAEILRSHASVATIGGAAGLFGGLTGASIRKAAVINSSSDGDVSAGDGAYVGGLTGANVGRVLQSFATGNSVGGKKSLVGGLTGFNLDSFFGKIVSSYATGASSAGKGGTAGGLVGDNAGVVVESYSTGAPSAALIGGLIGFDDSSSGAAVYTSYWDTDMSGVTDLSQGAGNIPNDPGITGLSTAQLQAGLPADFDARVWTQAPNINSGLPYLIGNPPAK